VYALHTGPLLETPRQWAALLWAGPDATLSHYTAAAHWGFPPIRHASLGVHLTVPGIQGRRVPAGIVVHRSRVPLDTATRDGRSVTSPLRTLRDLLICTQRPDDATALLAGTMQRRLVQNGLIYDLLRNDSLLRHRSTLLGILQYASTGAESLLEVGFLRDMDRHGLPRPRLQVRFGGGILDGRYEGFDLSLELDGKLGHLDTESWLRDTRRDQAEVAAGRAVLRFTGRQLVSDPCEVAAVVSAALRARGWTGELAPCPRCRMIRR
jgi:very-short-patch-repair endonuclease